VDRPMGIINRSFWSKTTALHPGLQFRTLLGLLIVVILMVLIGLLSLDQEATITEANTASALYKDDVLSLQQECRDLQAKIAEQTSMSRLAPQAPAIGLAAPSHIPTLSVKHTERPTGALTPAQPARAASVAQSPWWWTAVSRLEQRFRSGHLSGQP
jgi:hypothetical protein